MLGDCIAVKTYLPPSAQLGTPNFLQPSPASCSTLSSVRVAGLSHKQRRIAGELGEILQKNIKQSNSIQKHIVFYCKRNVVIRKACFRLWFSLEEPDEGHRHRIFSCWGILTSAPFHSSMVSERTNHTARWSFLDFDFPITGWCWMPPPFFLFGQ